MALWKKTNLWVKNHDAALTALGTLLGFIVLIALARCERISDRAEKAYPAYKSIQHEVEKLRTDLKDGVFKVENCRSLATSNVCEQHREEFDKLLEAENTVSFVALETQRHAERLRLNMKQMQDVSPEIFESKKLESKTEVENLLKIMQNRIDDYEDLLDLHDE